MNVADINREIEKRYRALYQRGVFVRMMPEEGTRFDDLRCFREHFTCLSRDDLFSKFRSIHLEAYPNSNVVQYYPIFNLMASCCERYLFRRPYSICAVPRTELRQMASLVRMQSMHVTWYYPNFVFGALMVFATGLLGEHHEVEFHTHRLYFSGLLNRIMGVEAFFVQSNLVLTDTPRETQGTINL